MVDSHCHLDFPDYQADFADVLRRTQVALEFVVNIGTDVRTSERAADLAAAYPFIYAAVGIHPDEALSATPGDIDRLATLAKHERVVAIGECGLDYAKLDGTNDTATKQQQHQLFWQQINLARTTQLPLVIHCRDAYDDLLAVLRESCAAGVPIRGVVHCFLGSLVQAQALLELGLYLSFTGIITFKNASVELLEVVRMAPLERLMVETDAPFLAPVPHRGTRNEPSYVGEVAKKVAAIKGLTLSQVDKITSSNARALFGVAG